MRISIATMKRLNSILVAAIVAGCAQSYGCIFVQSSAIADRSGAGNPISAREPAEQLRHRQSIGSDNRAQRARFLSRAVVQRVGDRNLQLIS
jgi:hypothetical protein